LTFEDGFYPLNSFFRKQIRVSYFSISYNISKNQQNRRRRVAYVPLSVSLLKANSSTSDSFVLYTTLSKVSIPESYVLMSFDVISLFTNVPLDLAINSVKNRWNFIEWFTKIPMVEFVSIVNFVLSSTFFTFNNVIYKQIYGTLSLITNHHWPSNARSGGTCTELFKNKITDLLS